MLRPATHIRYHIAAILAVHWIQFVAQYKRWIRPVVFENVRKVLACRTPVLGCHIYQCKDCGHVELIPHSCKSRFCPTCGKHATDVWANQVLNGFLDVAYHHLIMAIPWQLRIVIIMNRKAGLNLLVHAATEAIQQWARDIKKMRMGILIVIHTFFAAMINKLWKITWYAYIGASLLDPRFSIQYIGRYTKRAVMAEYRIVYYDGKIIRFSYKDYAEGGKTSYMTLKVHTFIGRLIRHIPDKHFPMIRYAGLFSNRWRKQYLAQCRVALNQSETDDADTNISTSWAQRKSEYTGIDPLQCPNCDKPLTFVGSFFGNWSKLQYLFVKAGKDSTIAAALLRPG